MIHQTLQMTVLLMTLTHLHLMNQTRMTLPIRKRVPSTTRIILMKRTEPRRGMKVLIRNQRKRLILT